MIIVIEYSAQNIPSTSPKPARRTGFLDEGFYDNFTHPTDEPTIDQVDLDEELSSNDSGDEVSRFMDQCANDYDIEFEPLGYLANSECPIHHKSGSSLENFDNMDCEDTYPD